MSGDEDAGRMRRRRRRRRLLSCGILKRSGGDGGRPRTRHDRGSARLVWRKDGRTAARCGHTEQAPLRCSHILLLAAARLREGSRALRAPCVLSGGCCSVGYEEEEEEEECQSGLVMVSPEDGGGVCRIKRKASAAQAARDVAPQQWSSRALSTVLKSCRITAPAAHGWISAELTSLLCFLLHILVFSYLDDSYGTKEGGSSLQAHGRKTTRFNSSLKIVFILPLTHPSISSNIDINIHNSLFDRFFLNS